MWFSCLFGHSYKAVAVHHYRDNSFHEPGSPSTTVTSLCGDCGKIKKKSLYGVGFQPLSVFQHEEKEPPHV